MRLTSISANNFLSFRNFELDTNRDLTVVTGPNGAGKSNLGRCLDLALCILANRGPDANIRLAQYESAGREGARQFEIQIGLDLTEPWELSLVRDFACATAISGAS